MRPARSRRVQAQRKFAQGAYVPPNVAAVAAADPRREPVQDARNVTINHMSATSLLDVVSLQGMHTNLLPKPVVLIERLRGTTPSRGEPQPSRTHGTVQPGPSVSNGDRAIYQNMARVRRPINSPKLPTFKKRKEYKRMHSMSLRSRRLSKLELNRLIAESCAPNRSRRTVKRVRKASSDEDEPLILLTPRKRLFRQVSSNKQNGTTRISSPMPGTSKYKTVKKVVKIPKKNASKKTSPKKPSKAKAPEYTFAVREDSLYGDMNDARPDSVTSDSPDDLILLRSPFVPAAPPPTPVPVSSGVPVCPATPVTSVAPIASVPVSLAVPSTGDLVCADLDAGQSEDIYSHSKVGCVAAESGPSHEDFLNCSDARSKKTIARKNCKADSFKTVQDVISTPKELMDNRCYNCKSCNRIDKLLRISRMLHRTLTEGTSSSQQINPALLLENLPAELETFDTEDSPADKEMGDSTLKVTMIEESEEGEESYLYLDLVPKHMGLMMKLGMRVIHGKDLMSVCLAPRSELKGESQKFVDLEQGQLLDRLCVTLTRSLQEKARLRRLNKSSTDMVPNGIDLTPRNVEPRDEADVQCAPGTEKTQVPKTTQINASETNVIPAAETNLIQPAQSNLVQNFDFEGMFSAETMDTQDSDSERVFILETTAVQESEGEQITTLKKSEVMENEAGQLFTLETAEIQVKTQRPGTDETTETQVSVAAETVNEAEKIRQEKEVEIARLDKQRRKEISRINEEKRNYEAELSRYVERFTELQKQKERDVARIREEIKANLETQMAAEREVDSMAKALEKEKDAKDMDAGAGPSRDSNAPSTSAMQTSVGGTMVDAPVYYPTEEEFQDPIAFFEKIAPEASKYGICKVVPPLGWKPPCRVNDGIRFCVTNQYISRLFSRWGPAARELCAIKLCLRQHNVNFTRPPLLDGMEVNLPKLYHLVQRYGGFETVIDKNRWTKVAEDMKFSKPATMGKKLDQIYMKYLLPYDTLSHQERQEIMRKVEMAWNRKNQKLLDRAMNPLYRQKRMLGLLESSDDETEDEDTAVALSEAEDCIIKGSFMTRAKFEKVATMTFENVYGQGAEESDTLDVARIEEQYWRLVTLGTDPICVHTAAVDTGDEGHGFIKNKNDSYGRHPWNPKMVVQHYRNVLRYLGPVLGVTVPTLLLGMLFSTSCWHKDPHALPWLEFQHKGPTRIWYGIPCHQADNFRKAVETLCPTSCQNKGLWLPTDITMIPPHVLREHNVTLSRLTQNMREFILAFPNAYTCCISTGYTESESAYFAPPAWLQNLWQVFKEARESCEPTMFAMEHLLYNIGKDPKADLETLKMAQPIYDRMLREEVTNRQMLQERGLTFVVQDLQRGPSTSRKKAKNSALELDECEYCRATLFLSKVKGVTSRSSVLCLEHALKLLETDKYKNAHLSNIEVQIHISVKELNSVHDDMKRRLGIDV